MRVFNKWLGVICLALAGLILVPAFGGQGSSNKAAELERVEQLEDQFFELYDKGKYQAAVPLAEQALQIRERVLGPEHADTARNLINLAELYRVLGQYDKALPLLQRALAITEKAFGPKHERTATSLNDLADLYRNLGQYDKALPLHQRALAIREKVLGPEHANTATSLNNLAALYYALGQYDKVLPFLQRALAIREKALGPEHAFTAQSLNNLAELYRTLGQYDKALPFFQRALAIREKVLGPEHELTATSLNNLALLHYDIGQYDKALPLHQRALVIDEKALGVDHPRTAIDLNNLARLYGALGQYDKALPLYRRALAIHEKVLGPEHANTASSLNNLAALYYALGQYDKALPFMQRALAISEKALGPEHDDNARNLNNLAELYRTIGQHNKALSLYQRALAIREKAFGPEHELTALSLSNLAIFHGRQRKPDEALSLFLRAQHATDNVIERTFPILTEQEKLKFVEKQEGDYHGTLSLIHRQLADKPDAVRAGLDLVLSRKGIVFDAQARQQEAIANSLDPETKKLWDELAGKRAVFSKLLQNKPDKMNPEEYQAKLKALQDEIARLEGQIASKSALVAEEFKQRQVTSKEVAKALGKDAALVEFVKIQDYGWDKGKWENSWRYLAFALKSDGLVKLVDLGEAEALEKGVQTAIKALGKIGSDKAGQEKASLALDALLWQPLTGVIGDAGKVVFSPDGLLNLVPFSAVQDKDGSYLIERKEVMYVTSGRDLAKGDAGIKPETALYLAANPQFDLKVSSQAEPAESRGLTHSRGFSMTFAQLPGTEKEAKEVPGYLEGKKTVLMGREATEESVLSVKRPKVLHLATHGFFLQDQPDLLADGIRGSGVRGLKVTGSDAQEAPRLPAGYENPLVRSGLALAGANHANEAKGERDGLLTALEVSGMDLHGTELVTLSACETGRGDVKSGEGVFGLRRAFALAGAKNLVMSLWPVSDEVTAAQMQTLYREYGKQKSPAEALRKAQIETIAGLRKKYGYAEPALWAPFIVQGR